MIKDSGERTEFASGAVRDMHVGKGRFDLLPWYAIHEVAKHCEEGALKYGERNVDKGIPVHSLIDSAIRHLVKFIHGEKDEPHLRAAAWNVLWALEQEMTHPEMNDLPVPGKNRTFTTDQIFDMVNHVFGIPPTIEDAEDPPERRERTCLTCKHYETDGDDEPCVNCTHNYSDKYMRKVNEE